MSGTVVLQGVHYVVYDKDVRIVLPKSQALIPGDVIDIATTAVISRQEQTTLAIVRGRTKTHVFLFCPLLGALYNPSIVGDHEIGSTWLLHIPSNPRTHPVLVKSLDSVYNRAADLDTLIAAYRSQSPPWQPPTYQSPLYTKEIQDQRELDTFSIDPVGCKDADDAITVLPAEHRVLVHIVDIHAHLIASSLQTEWQALTNAFTLYLPHKNTHIFPTEDAEDRFSLKVGVERSVITIDIRFKTDGSCHVDSFDLYRSTIVNKRAYTYEEALPLLTDSAFCRTLVDSQQCGLIIPSLQLKVEPATGNLLNTTTQTNVDIAHKFVERLMVLANMLVSQHLSQHIQTRAAYGRIPQRFHAKLKTPPPPNPHLSVVANSFLAIKSYAAAKYDADQAGHFGLQVPTYTHFTSPIRRYFDCILHHMLAGAVYEDAVLDGMLAHINTQERKVDGLQKLFRQWKLCSYLKPGMTCLATITGVNSAAIYFLIEEFMLDGSLHVSKLGGTERWQLVTHSLQSGSQVLRLGTQLTLRIEQVNQIMSTIDWTVVK